MFTHECPDCGSTRTRYFEQTEDDGAWWCSDCDHWERDDA